MTSRVTFLCAMISQKVNFKYNLYAHESSCQTYSTYSSINRVPSTIVSTYQSRAIDGIIKRETISFVSYSPLGTYSSLTLESIPVFYKKD